MKSRSHLPFRHPLAIAAFGLLAVASPILRAQEPAAAAEALALDPKAKEIMDSVATFFAGTESFSVDAVMKIDQTIPESAGGGQQKMEMIQTLSLQRPDRFSLVTKGDVAMTPSIYATDGKVTIVLDRTSIIESTHEGDLGNVFVDEDFGYDAAADSNHLLDQNTTAAFLRDLVFDSEKNGWDDNVTAAKYDGEVELDGQKAHKLTLTSSQKEGPGGKDLEIDIALWVAAGEQPLPLRVVPDTSKIVAAMTEDNPAFKGMKVDITGSYTDWAIGKAPKESAFKPEYDDDATKYETFGELVAAMNEQDGGPAGDPTELVGEAAPDFEIAMLDGSTFKLSDYKGKKTVILDFWATWCGPCMQALPILIETAAAYADKDVLLVAVNQGEDKETIDPVLKQKKWIDLKVALDTDGAVAGEYKVGGIPQTVIVGKDGTVRKVHVGFSPQLAEELPKELDAILAE